MGFLLYKTLESWRLVTFDPELSLGHVTTATTTLLVAVLFAWYLQRQTHSNRKEKDILLRHMDLLLDGVTEFERFRDGGAVTDIAASLKRLSLKSRSINDILSFLKYPTDVRSLANCDDEIRAVRVLATETPIVQLEQHANDPACNSVVRDGIIQLAAEKRLQLELRLQELKLRVLKAQISVNKA